MNKYDFLYISSNDGDKEIFNSFFIGKDLKYISINFNELNGDNFNSFDYKFILFNINDLEELAENKENFKAIKSKPFFLLNNSDLQLIDKTKLSSLDKNLKFQGYLDFENFPNHSSLQVTKYCENLNSINYNKIYKEKYEAITKSNRDGIFFTNYDKIIVDWTASAEKIFGFSKKKAIGNKFTELILQKDQIKDFIIEFENIKNGKETRIFDNILELYCKTKLDNYFPVEMSVSKFDLQGENLLCFICRDVTIMMNSEEELTKIIEELHVINDFTEQNARELIELNSKLEENELALQVLNANKDRFFSIIAHDLKGPFQALLGYSELLASTEMSLSQEEIREFAESLNDSAKNLFKLLENLLEWARLQRGQFTIESESFDFKEVADVNLELIRHRAEQKKIILQNEITENSLVFADKNSIDTVVRNLLANAIKFTKEGDTVGIRLETDEDNGFQKISIFDTGVGISPEIQAKLFRIDSKHTTSGTANEQGTGLGLILCKDMVEKNGGNIYVESEIGKGSSFIFNVPIGTK